MTFINTERIQSFVDRVEAKKRFARDEKLIFRHLVEEVGELSRALWLLESRYASPLTGERLSNEDRVGYELVDIISLSVYIADVLKIPLNDLFPKRFRAVARQYGVECPEGEQA